MITFPHPAYAAAAIAFDVALALTPVVRAICIRLQIFDAPGPLKIHSKPIPRLGGLAIFVAIIAAVASVAPLRTRSAAAFLTALALVWLAGFIDDLRNLSPAIRVAAQFTAGVLLWIGGWRITVFENRLLGLCAVCLAVSAMANATNLWDGMDGLATGTVAIIAAAYLALPKDALSGLGFIVAVSVLGACVGFLRFNWPRPEAQLFLGDSGSNLLGFTIAFLAVDFRNESSSAPSALAFLLLVAAVPLLDAVLAAVRRLRNHRSALQGDRSHLYDLIRARGCSIAKILTQLYGITVATCLVGLLLIYKPSKETAALAVASVGILLGVAIKLGSLKREGVPGITKLVLSSGKDLQIGVFESGARQEKSAAT
jgi:UDP-GlcNAc:undecaprenyl-phosphate GlcNAc-1-phosphate transferase